MRNIYLLCLMLLAGGVLWIAQSSTASNYLANDAALERRYRAAAEVAAMPTVPMGRGCETIPFPFQRDCIELRKQKEAICRSGSRLKCNDQKNPLYHAKKNKNKEEITQIRDLCVTRRDLALNCIQIRNTVQGVFDAAKERIEDDRIKFERKLNVAKDKETEEFYRWMISYADTILGYYNREKGNHEGEIANLRVPLKGCIDLVEEAEEALKVLSGTSR